MKLSAGVLVSFDHKVIPGFLTERKYLFGHPTNQGWYGTFSIPKGEIDDRDSGSLGAALRETREEVGMQLSYKDIENPQNPIIINYKSGGKTYKKVYVYKAHLTDLTPHAYLFDLETLQIKPEYLQLEEIDYARFMSVLMLEDKIFHRFIPLIAEELEKELEVFKNV